MEVAKTIIRLLTDWTAISRAIFYEKEDKIKEN